MTHRTKQQDAIAWDQPFFCRKWLQNRTNGYRISRNNTERQTEAMQEELKHAGDIAKDPASFSIVAYAVMLALSMWGGLVRVIKEVALKEKSFEHIACIFIAEMCVSGFVGTITFSLCISAHLSYSYTGALTAIAGYMGGRSLSFFEAIYKAWKVKP